MGRISIRKHTAEVVALMMNRGKIVVLIIIEIIMLCLLRFRLEALVMMPDILNLEVKIIRRFKSIMIGLLIWKWSGTTSPPTATSKTILMRDTTIP